MGAVVSKLFIKSLNLFFEWGWLKLVFEMHFPELN